MPYTAPSNDSTDFEFDLTSAYTAPSNDSVDFQTGFEVTVSVGVKSATPSPLTSGGATESVAASTIADTTTTKQNATITTSAIVNSIVAVINANDILSFGTTSTQSNGIAEIVSLFDEQSNVNTNTTGFGVTNTTITTSQKSSLDTSSIINAIRTKIETTNRVSIGTATTDVGGNISIGNTNPLQTVNDAITTSFVASQFASITTESGDSFTDAYIDAIRSDGLSFASIGTIENSTVTPLAQIENAFATPTESSSSVQIFSVVSETGFGTLSKQTTENTKTTIVGLTDSVGFIPISPTMGIVISVPKGEFGLQGAFSDSLSASVGANTTIEVAKTKTFTDQTIANIDSSTVVEAIGTVVELLGEIGDSATQTTVEGIIAASLLTQLGSSSTSANGIGDTNTAISDSLSGGGFSSSDVSAITELFDGIDSTSNEFTETVGGADATIGDLIGSNGSIETETLIAGLLSNVDVDYIQSNLETKTTTETNNPSIESIIRQREPFTESDSDSVTQFFSILQQDSTANSKAKPTTIIAELLSSTIGSDVDTETLVSGLKTLVRCDGLEPILQLLVLALYGDNDAVVTNSNNQVRILNADSNNVNVL
jgi:hypothetical protein